MSRAILRCQTCRHSLLDSFAALTGISIPSQSLRPLRQQSDRLLPQRRNYTSTHSFRQTTTSSTTAAAQELSDEASISTSSHPEPVGPASSDAIPWYLQIPSPTPPAPVSPILALQEIPPLPNNPPTILEPLLQHLSVQIGLDNLSLLDLRSLHPPPALGANLLMIIGTARSVKHLNVSADRFCRWLRTEWKLRPYADGLLGRNELKLKLRRKARRQKMMGLVGGREVGPVDDGITTGWVCVNVGIVDENLRPRPRILDADEVGYEASSPDEATTQSEEAESSQVYQNPEKEEDLREDAMEHQYIGFGSRTASPRIVVQMFTEEKRLEMDLEGLWEDRNTRRTRKEGQRDARAAGWLNERDTVGAAEDRDLDIDIDIERRQDRSERDRLEKVKGNEVKKGGVWGD